MGLKADSADIKRTGLLLFFVPNCFSVIKSPVFMSSKGTAGAGVDPRDDQIDPAIFQRIRQENKQIYDDFKKKSSSVSMGCKLDLLFYGVMALILYTSIYWFKYDFLPKPA
jgi:hypothetical protein